MIYIYIYLFIYIFCYLTCSTNKIHSEWTQLSPRIKLLYITPLHTCSYSMLESVSNLKKKAKKGPTAENTAFQQLFLLVGMHFFKVQHTWRVMIYSSITAFI